MTKIQSLSFPSRGTIQIGKIHVPTGRTTCVQVGHNIVTYEGVDLLGKFLAGVGTEINVMYMEFQNGGIPPVITPDPADGRDYYAALESGLTTADYIRVPLTADPVLSSSDATKFLTNKVTVYAMSTGITIGRGAKPFTATVGSIVYGVALVAAPDMNDATADIVFSRSYDFTPVTKDVGQEVCMNWAHIFAESMISSSLSP